MPERTWKWKWQWPNLLATTDGGSSAAEFIELARVLAAGRIGLKAA